MTYRLTAHAPPLRGSDISPLPLAGARSGHRFRHAAHFVRWRLDKAPSDCRYGQLETVPPYALREVFGGTVQGAPTLAPGA